MTHNDSYGARVFWSYLMLLFFGVFGVHRFYLGRPLSGFIYLITGGICGLGILFDIFYVPAMAANPG
jgi:TM2 domain-containing membrane protein YozV